MPSMEQCHCLTPGNETNIVSWGIAAVVVLRPILRLRRQYPCRYYLSPGLQTCLLNYFPELVVEQALDPSR